MIEIEGLRKRYGKLEVLRGLDLNFKTGKVTAIIGPNAAGKTTLIKAILGLVKPDAGWIRVNGTLLNGDWDYRRHIGYMPQIARYPDNLTIRELLAMLRDLRAAHDTQAELLIDMFQLTSELEKPLRTLSGGTLQKVSAVIAFMFDPAILILDEPSAGLDPVSSSQLKDFILSERDRGKTILLTSHIMSELEELSDEAVFLLEGNVNFNGSMQAIKASTQESKLERAVARMMKEATQ